MILEGTRCSLRPYRADDGQALQPLANDALVSRWMTRRFPHPYTRADAEHWLSFAVGADRQCNWAIAVEGALAGGIGFEALDGERVGSATFGYWLGRGFWERGIASEAARIVSDHLLERDSLRSMNLRRLEAHVFAANVASARVLEKAGFTCEGRLRDYYVDREDHVCDAMLYGRIR